MFFIIYIIGNSVLIWIWVFWNIVYELKLIGVNYRLFCMLLNRMLYVFFFNFFLDGCIFFFYFVYLLIFINVLYIGNCIFMVFFIGILGEFDWVLKLNEFDLLLKCVKI